MKFLSETRPDQCHVVGGLMESREQYLNNLDATVTEFLEIYQNPLHSDVQVYELWTAKDVLCHITYWHESFARNVDDLVHDRKPHPLKGRFIDLNQQGVEAIRNGSLDMVCGRLLAAHAIIQNRILSPGLKLIPYKVGSRDYSPEEHMDIVIKHIEQHGSDVRKAIQLKTRVN
jgi:hypothetical protein